jgi:hypothetical protein
MPIRILTCCAVSLLKVARSLEDTSSELPQEHKGYIAERRYEQKQLTCRHVYVQVIKSRNEKATIKQADNVLVGIMGLRDSVRM